MNDTTLMTRKECINKMGLLAFLKTRVLTPMDFYRFFRENYSSKDGQCAYFESAGCKNLIGKIQEIIFFTRYINFKSIEGYDFV